jgi:hypothetical protein
LATSWDPNPSGDVSSLAVNGATVYVAGGFTSIGGHSRNYIAALDATTGLATAWDPNASFFVSNVAVNSSTVFAGGDFTSIGGQARNRIAALDPITGLATAWDPSASGVVRALAADELTVYAGGDFTSMGSKQVHHLAAISVSTTDIPAPGRLRRDFQLLPNLPNPFNVSTVIRFSLATAENVTLKIYDISGREIATLLRDQHFEPGEHHVEFSSSTLPTGIYLCHLQAGDTVYSRRMVLIR